MILKLMPLITGAFILTGCVATAAPDKLNLADSTIAPSAAASPELQKSSYQLGLLHLKVLREGQFNFPS